MDATFAASLLTMARKAAGWGQEQAADRAGVSIGTIGNWEKAAGEQGAIKPLLYMRALAQQSTQGRQVILNILGLAEADLTLDPKIEARVDLFRDALESNDPLVQDHVRFAEGFLRERLRGENRAAST